MKRHLPPNFLLSMAALLLLSTSPVSAGEVIVGGAKGYVKILLDNDVIKANEPVRGFILFKLTSVKDRFGKAYDAVALNGPLVDVVIPDDMKAAVPKVVFNSPLQSTVKVGHEYKLRFHIRMDEAFRNLLRKPKEEYAYFKTGKFHLNAIIFSPPRVKNIAPTSSLFHTLTQQFKSAPVAITVEPADAETPRLNSSTILHAIGQANGAFKKRLISFHLERGDLTTAILLKYIAEASGSEKAGLVELYLSRNLPGEALKDFTPPGKTIEFTGHGKPPVFLLMHPNQRVRMTFKVDTLHRMAIAGKDTLIIANTKIDFTAPSAEGLYEMHDSRHNKPWGWIYVRDDSKASATDNLRPDTQALSDKVAAAIFKRDEKALSALAVPDFRSSDVIRRMKFKLGSGDIRYLKSIGTKNNVKTRMQVNIASAGEEPVFARELQLEFVRIGNELKLTQVAITDVD